MCVWWQGPGRGEEDIHWVLQGKVKHGLGGVKSQACCTTHIKQTNKQKTEQNRKDTTKRLSGDSSSQGKNKLLVLCTKSFQSCPTLCNPMDCSPPGSSVHGILQAGMPSCRGSSQLGELVSLLSPALVGRFFPTRATFIFLQVKAQACPLVFPFSSFL